MKKKKPAEGGSTAQLRRQIESRHRALEAMVRALADAQSRIAAAVTIGPGPAAPRPKRPPVRPATAPDAWGADPLPEAALAPPAGWSALSLEGTGAPPIGILLFGLDGEAVRNAVARIADQQRRAMNFVPVFMTDASDHRPFRRAGYIFEYFPKAAYGSLGNAQAFRDKLDFVRRKWSIPSVIDLSVEGYVGKRAIDAGSLLPTHAETRGVSRPPPPVIPPPPPDVAALKAEYRAKGLDRERDSFVLYRIIGNDLYPRHRRGQSEENVRFILENEPPLERCEKRWVINRIVDPEQEARIVAMLKARRQRFVRIPFDWEEYQHVPWDFEAFTEPSFFLRGARHKLGERRLVRAEVQVRRHKNNYVMNNNGARNAALRDGRTRAKWVLPFDGNCFFTAPAWREIVDAITRAPHLKYFVVPMARMTDNTALFDPNFRPEAEDEPQLIFRKDTTERFDERYPYGRRPKVELFWRLAIPGDWDEWHDDPWELPRSPRSADAGQLGRAGWVARMFSGMAALETPTRASLMGRGEARNEAIISTLDYLDEELVRRSYDPARLTLYDEAAVAGLARAPVRSERRRRLADLKREAEAALRRGPYSVVDKTALPPSGDRHDYFHPAPYWWPNPDTADGMPYVRRDGERRPGTQLYEPGSEQFDRTRLQRLFDDTTILALAWRATGNHRFAEHGARLVRCWFVDPETRMNPHIRYAQVRPGHDGDEGASFGVIEMKDLYFFLDAVRLLEASGSLGPDDGASFRAWLTDYLGWLRTSRQGETEKKALNNHGPCYDLQVGAIAAYLGDIPLLLSTFFTSAERMLEHFNAAGEQPTEMARTQSAHYCCFNLQSWLNLGTLAASCGRPIWTFTGADGRGLGRAAAWLLPFMAKGPWPGQQIDPFDRDRFLPLWFKVRQVLGPVPGMDAAGVPDRFAVRPLFSPHDGIMPFWMLGRDLGSD